MYTYNDFYELGHSHGWAMGKNGRQLIIDDDKITHQLATKTMAIVAYKNGFDEGFKMGVLNAERDHKIKLSTD